MLDGLAVIFLQRDNWGLDFFSAELLVFQRDKINNFVAFKNGTSARYRG